MLALLLFHVLPIELESTVRLISPSGTPLAVQVTRSRLGKNAEVIFDRIPTPNSSQHFQVSVFVRAGLARRGGVGAHVTVATRMFDGNAMEPSRSGSSGYQTVLQEGRPYTFPIAMAKYAGVPLTVEVSARPLR